MGLQSGPPSTPPLSAMACLDVESPSLCRGQFKSVLQLCLQQRRTREQLVEQGIMPPLKTPAAFHEKIRSLERARTGNFLKHKLCSRPERSELVRMHILQETQAEPSLQATQMALKRARLADDLNEKIAQRPGPMELVEKKILAVEPAAEEEASHGERTNDSKSADVYSFDEDSGDASSPQRPCSQQSPPGSTPPTSPAQCGGPEAPAAPAAPAAAAAAAACLQVSSPVQASSDSVTVVCPQGKQASVKASTPQPAAVASSLGSVLVKQSLAKLPVDKNRSKRGKEPKPRVKKLKYHQYIPPDQKQELNEVPMDSTYARLLQQQQQFLQLQILSQQQQFGYQPVPPATVKSTTEVQTSCSGIALSANAAHAAPAKPQQTSQRLDHLPANLDEMKVAELKMELKLRSLPVSGTKIDLIERLKAYRENSSVHAAADKASENPVSPVASKVSSLFLEDGPPSDAAPPPACENPAGQEEAPLAEERDSDKDKRLYEKERQIEELMRKLEQEQRLVEELKMQLEVEKRSQQGDSPPLPALLQVKEEKAATPSSSCSASSSPLRSVAAAVKQEDADDGCRSSPPHRFVGGSDDLREARAGARVLLPASLPVTVPPLIQPSQKVEGSVASQQPCCVQALSKSWRVESATASLVNTFPVSGRPAGASSCRPGAQQSAEFSASLVPRDTQTAGPSPPTFLLQHKAVHCAPKSRDPPPYEDAVKQKRSMLTAVQAPSAASQHMDDLFDVLIESGEISPFVRLDPPSQQKPLAVTASVTTLPVNTVLSRPPPLVHVAQPPSAGPHALKLMEELHSTMEVDFDDDGGGGGSALQQDNMDWLDLTLSVPAEGVAALDMSSPVGVFSSDFLDPHELQLNWE